MCVGFQFSFSSLSLSLTHTLSLSPTLHLPLDPHLQHIHILLVLVVGCYLECIECSVQLEFCYRNFEGRTRELVWLELDANRFVLPCPHTHTHTTQNAYKARCIWNRVRSTKGPHRLVGIILSQNQRESRSRGSNTLRGRRWLVR